MSVPIDLAVLLPPVEAIDAVPVDALPAAMAHLAALQTRAAARLAARAGNGTARPAAPPDELLDIEAAADLVRRSVSWVRHHGCRLPGFCQPHGKGSRVQWSRVALEAWVRGGA